MSRARSLSTTLLLLLGLGAAVSLRVAAGAPAVAASQTGGVIFVAALAALILAAGWRPGPPRPASLFLGLVGGCVLLAGPLWLHASAAWSYAALPLAWFPSWAGLIVLIAGSEEILLRGLLFSACDRIVGPAGAVALTSIAFAAIHVPLYGPGAVPLDLAVGMWLGGLRLIGGGVAAPAIAHIVADLGAWWLL